MLGHKLASHRPLALEDSDVTICPLRMADWKMARRFRETNNAGTESVPPQVSATASHQPGDGFYDPKSSRAWLAKNGEDVLGIVCLTLEGKAIARIYDLSVDARYDNTGIALLLMTSALSDGKRLGCLKVRLDASVISASILALLIDGGILLGGGRGAEQAGLADYYLNLYRGNEHPSRNGAIP